MTEELIKFINQIDGRFPDVNRIVPELESSISSHLEIGLNYKYLARVNASLTKLSKGIKTQFHYAKFNFKGANDAVRVDATIGKVHALIVLMPCRL